MRFSLRRQLVVVVLLAVALCAVSIGALARVVGVTTEQRLQRARALVDDELGRTTPSSGASAPPAVVGMRAGTVAAGAIDGDVDVAPAEVKRALRTLAAVAPIGKSEVVQVQLDDAVVIIGAQRDPTGAVRWITYPVRMTGLLRTFRTVGLALAIAATVLALVTFGSIIAMTRGTRGLLRALRGLESDLGAPVARPVIGELAEVADGIASLARSLAEAERTRDELRAELAKRERLAALGRVAAGVAHEVRNPLASMKLRVDLLTTSSDVTPEVASELGTISDEIARLDRLVGDLLVVAGRRAGPREPTDLGALAAERARQLSPWAEERGVRFDTQGAALRAIGKDGIARAVDNLLRNAVEAAPAGTVVHVAVREDEGGDVVLSVEDEGTGVPQERERELFEPFFTTKPEGTGLGLALCRAVALSEGGTVRYARREDRTCFELRLPAEA